jgi:hypothetical protein
MSLLSKYQDLVIAMHEQIALLVNEHGISPEWKTTNSKFLNVESFGLTVNGSVIMYLNESIVLDTDGREYHIGCLETNGELESAFSAIDDLSESLNCKGVASARHIYIRGYRTEEDLDAQRSEAIDAITEESWEESDEGQEIIEENESDFFHIEVTNEDGKIIS